MLNPFAGDGYSLAALTAAINKLPNNYGRLNDLGLFPTEGVTQRTILVEEYHGVLTILPTMPLGAPGTVGVQGKRKVRSFVIPHIPHDDVILPSEVQGVRAFGQENADDTIANLMARKLQTMRNKHGITLEWLRMGALKGIILDADGTTLYNLYTEFGITAKTISFALGTGTTNIRGKCLEVKRHVEANLQGEVMTGIRCLCSSEFFDSLVDHAKVQEAFKYFQNRQDLSGDYRRGFEFGGIIFEEYVGQATDKDGNVRRFIASGEAHCFPEGTQDTFKTHFAPADFNEAANTIGLPVYAKQEERKFGRGWDLHTQSNPLPICRRPEVLVKLTSA